MKNYLTKITGNPKFQTALFTLLSTVLAIGFFLSPGAGVYGEVGLGKGFLIASLNPMAAAFTLIPFVMSVIGIGISAKKWHKQTTDKKRLKANNRLEFIEGQKKLVIQSYEEEYNKLTPLIDSSGIALSDSTNQRHLAEIKKFINDEKATIEAKSTIDKGAGGGSKYSYEELLDLYAGAKEKAVELQKLKAEIKAWDVLGKTDLKTGMGKIETSVNNVIKNPGIVIKAVTKLAGADKSPEVKR